MALPSLLFSKSFSWQGYSLKKKKRQSQLRQPAGSTHWFGVMDMAGQCPPPRAVTSVPLPELPWKQQDLAQQIPRPWLILAGLLGKKKFIPHLSTPNMIFFFFYLS